MPDSRKVFVLCVGDDELTGMLATLVPPLLLDLVTLVSQTVNLQSVFALDSLLT